MEIHLLVIITILGGLGGFAALLRSRNKISWRAGLSATLNSALLSLALGAIGLHYNTIERYWLVIGGSILAGLGGNTAVELILTTAVFVVKTKYNLENKHERDKKDLE